LPAGIEPADLTENYGFIESKELKRVRFKTLAGFELISGALTIDEDFKTSVRPWDFHNYSIVSARRLELSARGKARHLRDKFRKAQCKKCCFVTTLYPSGDIKDCGNINECKESTDATTAWALLFDWYSKSGFDRMGGFTTAQRDYLITQAGNQTLVQAIATRRTQTVWAGFVRRTYPRPQEWVFRLSAAAGDIQRSVDITSWSELKELLPELPDKVESLDLTSKTKLACAILGVQNGISEDYKPYYPIYKIELSHGYVVATGAATRYESTRMLLETGEDDDNVKEYYKALWGYQYNKAREWAKTRLAVLSDKKPTGPLKG
jgi:hypothetical protein